MVETVLLLILVASTASTGVSAIRIFAGYGHLTTWAAVSWIVMMASGIVSGRIFRDTETLIGFAICAVIWGAYIGWNVFALRPRWKAQQRKDFLNGSKEEKSEDNRTNIGLQALGETPPGRDRRNKSILKKK